MKKRTVKIGEYDTASHGWTLAACKISDPEEKENYVEKPGGDGSWNLTTVLTNGIPRYKNRTLTVALECSQGDREYRENLINDLVNSIDGFEWPIILPDRPAHYLTGQARVAVEYSDLAHARVNITANCEPWFYCSCESVTELICTQDPKNFVIHNGGRRASVPVLTVEGCICLKYGIFETKLDAGVYEWSPLLLTPGLHELEYSGNGTIMITFREAVLR